MARRSAAAFGPGQQALPDQAVDALGDGRRLAAGQLGELAERGYPEADPVKDAVLRHGQRGGLEALDRLGVEAVQPRVPRRSSARPASLARPSASA